MTDRDQKRPRTAHPFKVRLAGRWGGALLSALFATIRVRRVGDAGWRSVRAGGGRVVFVLWHGNLLPLAHLHRDEGVSVLVSEHGDGEIIARILAARGYALARGSSTRGGVQGLRELVRAARSGRDLAITPDGPRGPAHVFKPGALVAAALAGLPVVPVAVAASRGWHLGSWDSFLIPKPFSSIVVAYGDPVPVPRELDDDGRAALASSLQVRLAEVATEAATALRTGGRS